MPLSTEAVAVHSAPIVRANLAARLMRNPMGLASAIVIVVVLIAAVFASVLAPFDPNHTDAMNIMAAPGGTHLLGTDSAGRDIFSRILFGSQSTLIAAFVVVVTSIVLGVPTGLIAGYYGKLFDTVASWIANMLMSLPAMIVLLAVRASFGSSLISSMVVFGLLIAPGFFRLTRTAVMSVRNELYVDAARVSGLSDTRIMARHIFTVVRAPIIIQSAMISGIAISIQSGLEFLGLGDPTMISWGVMLNEGFTNIFTNPMLVLWPGLIITLTICSFALLGNALRDALEDRQQIRLSRAQKRARASVKLVPAANAKTTDAGVAASAPSSEHAGGNHLLSVDHLSVGYPQADGSLKFVVQDVSLFVDKGEVLGIVGESGSGKTQTAFSILGLLPDNAKIAAGHIVFDGTDLVSPDSGVISQKAMAAFRGKRIAYIPQEPMSNLDPAFKIGYQLVRPMTQLLGISKAEAKAKALEMLTTVGINNPERVFNSYPHEISGGMAQRVLIAGAVACNPDLLIADEPTTALDVTVQAEVLDLLRDLQKRLGMGMVLVTHNFGVVADLADRVVVMQYGRVVETGDVRSILRNPQQEYTQILLSSMLEGKTPMTMLTASAKEPANV
jgi:ABC-type dipeptide/oligopeptide/nickel transport system ATPase component/ABC-type dipeptide/oligopeptide/nickel transport system permease subunit